MTDLEIVQTAADRVVAEAMVHRDNLPMGSEQRQMATVSLMVLHRFAQELQRLRDQVYPR